MSGDRPISVGLFGLDSGREPVRERLKGMGPDDRKAIGEDVKTLQFGWPVGMPLPREIDAGKTQIEKVEVAVVAKKNVGSDFDEFLREEGILEEATAAAVKRVIAFQLAAKMTEHSMSKSEMARRMATSRSALDRLLDPENVSVTLQTLQSAVQALGGRLNVELGFDNKSNAA